MIWIFLCVFGESCSSAIIIWLATTRWRYNYSPAVFVATFWSTLWHENCVYAGRTRGTLGLYRLSEIILFWHVVQPHTQSCFRPSDGHNLPSVAQTMQAVAVPPRSRVLAGASKVVTATSKMLINTSENLLRKYILYFRDERAEILHSSHDCKVNIRDVNYSSWVSLICDMFPCRISISARRNNELIHV